MAQPAKPEVGSEEYNNQKIAESKTTPVEEANHPVWEWSDPFSGVWKGKDPKTFGFTQVPYNRAIANFHALDRESELIRLQELAFQAGLYGESTEREDIRWESYDDDTFKIWMDLTRAASLSARAGKKQTVWDKLQDLVEHRPANLGKKKKGREPKIIQLPDPRELEEVIRSIAPETIGREADESLTQDIIAMYTRIQERFQENRYALSQTEEGGTLQAPPSAAALAKFRLRTERPEEYEQHRSAQRSREYTALLEGLL